MNRIVNRCRDAVRRRRMMAKPTLEALEDRRVLSWYYPVRITYSFMPDGTSVGGVPSNLFQKLNAIAPTATWQNAFKKAAAIWQQVAGINLTQVSDNGDPVGGTGYQQGDPRYGDIRIGGTAMSMGYLGYAILPPPINGGPDAGDIVINTSHAWKINNDYDLQTVAIHEIGHALGLDHSAIASADMYSAYTSMKQTLHSSDVAAIQGIYGGVPADPTSNQTSSTAIDLSSLINAQSQVSYGAGYVTTATAFEWYKVTVPASTTGTMVVKMQSNNLSSLAPRLAVYNSNVASLGQAVAANVYGTTVTMTIPNVSPGQVYYFRASPGNAGAGSNGAFGLLINFGSTPQGAITPPNTEVLAQPDQGAGFMGQSVPSEETHRIPRSRHGHGHGHGHDEDHHEITLNFGGRSSVAHAMTIGHAHPTAPLPLPGQSLGRGQGPVQIAANPAAQASEDGAPGSFHPWRARNRRPR